jgi:magnesium and cobalt exporter, CNNM family
VGSILIIAVCLVASAFFSASETALLRLRENEVGVETETHRGPATFAIRDLLRSTSRLLVTILLGNNVVNILGASVASAFAVVQLGPERGVVVSTAVMTVLILVFCEVLPKAVAAAHPRGIAHAVALPLYLLHQVLRPLHRVFDLAIEPLVERIVGQKEGAGHDAAEDVLRLARRARLESAEGSPLSIIGAAAQAGRLTVEEIMVPRPQIWARPVETPPTLLLEQMLEERYTRVPIFEGSIDQVLGIVHLKDLARFVHEGGRELREILKPVMRVPERKPILRLLAEMQRSFGHVAIVKDEHGLTRGMLTQEDILEEIVGEIRDEFDQEELLSIRRLGEDSWEVLGRVQVRDFNRETGSELEAESGDTLGGLVFNLLGRAPRPGDLVSLPGYEVQVAEVSGPRIARVQVRRRAEPVEAG